MYGETIATCSEIHRSHSNTLPGQDAANLNAETGTAITPSAFQRLLPRGQSMYREV